MAPPEAESRGISNEKERMWSSMKKQMAKDTVTAGVIGTLATYLPFWQWDGTRWMGAVALSVVTWIILVAMEPEPNKKGS